MRVAPILSICAALGMLACSSSTAPESQHQRVLGVIAGYSFAGTEPTIEVNGRWVTVTVYTFGNGCYSALDTEVRVVGLEAFVTPYDANPGCFTRDLKAVPHQAVLHFSAPGTARINLRGIDRTTRNSQNMVGDTITIQRTVELR